jgi:hypothetical protein
MNRHAWDYIDRHIAEAGRTELRAIYPDGQVRWGIFDRSIELEAEIQRLKHEANLYITIQALKPCQASNQVNRSGSGATRNSDIGHFVRLPFDLDSVREPKTAATELQVENAREVAIDLRRLLSRSGWPLPALVCSGNGYHLIYRTPPLPNNADLAEQLNLIYGGLSEEIGNSAVEFDKTVRSAGRVLRVPGSLNLKGNPAQPREASIELPPRWRQVQPREIERLASLYQRLRAEPAAQAAQSSSHQFSGSGDYRSLDVVRWFSAHGHYIKPIEANKHAVRCPWQSEHTTESPATGSDSIIFETDGSWPGFFCHHSHCEGRDIRSVLGIWGDADQFCSRSFDRSADR